MLPIDKYLPSIKESLDHSPFVLLRASPGSGKTTRVPDYLAVEGKKKVAVLEPRRIATVGAANHIANLRGWTLGQEVGYQVRFESELCESTQVLFLTEGILLKKLQSDPLLSEFGYIVLDEFHERSKYSDVTIAHIKRIIQTQRPDLKLLIMSATIEAEELLGYLPGLHIIDVPGQSYSLEVILDQKPQQIKTDKLWFERVKSLVIKAYEQNPETSILVFVPGRGEVQGLCKELSGVKSLRLPVRALHGQLSVAEQRQIVQDSGHRIIVSTNVAESSITVPGVSVVVDSGLERVGVWDHELQIGELTLKRISRASAKQRAGRAARERNGRVYQAWMKSDELSMPADILPELASCDLRELSLLLNGLGYPNLLEFDWLFQPHSQAIEKAQSTTLELGLVNLNYQLTPLGSLALQLPLSFEHSVLISKIRNEKWATGYLPLIAFLDQLRMPNELRDQQDSQNDLLIAFEHFLESSGGLPRTLFQTIQQVARLLDMELGSQWSKNIADQGAPHFLKFQKVFLENYLALFPGRLVQRRAKNPTKGLLALGKGVLLSSKSTVKKSPYYVALQLLTLQGEVQVSCAWGLSEELTQNVTSIKQSVFEFFESDIGRGQYFKVKQKKFLSLILSEHREVIKDKVQLQKLIKSKAEEDYLGLIHQSPPLQEWVQRWSYYTKQTKMDSLMPELILVNLDEVIPKVTSWEELLLFEWGPYLEASLDYAEVQKFYQLCPLAWAHPVNGRKYPIVYDTEKAPRVEIMLRDLFGLASHPKVGDESLVFIVLGPHKRPIQVTQDILGFWKSSYPDIRKDMRGRYPRQPWPENPLEPILPRSP